MTIQGVGRPDGPDRSAGIAARPHRVGREAGAPPERSASDRIAAVLTPDEVRYFEELERLGRLTYGPRPAARDARPAPLLGQRIDAKA
jgi:hypothetical protein